MYFNHSFVLDTKPEYSVASATIDSSTGPFTVAVRNKNVVGLQFHPEKSQVAGKRILKDLIEGLCNA
jgi:glutamine amidotransferase